MIIRMSTLFILVFLIASCASNRNELTYQELPESSIQTGFVYDDNISMEISFVGIMEDRYVFETRLTNLAAYDIRVHSSQFVMKHNDQSLLHTQDLNTTIQELSEDQKKLEKRRKVNNWINGISVGIGIVSGITAQAPASTILSSIEPTLYIVDENTWISRDIQSTEDYISYLETATYDNDIIIPGASLTKDLFFDVFDMNKDIEIEFLMEDLQYSVSFPRSAFSY